MLPQMNIKGDLRQKAISTKNCITQSFRPSCSPKLTLLASFKIPSLKSNIIYKSLDKELAQKWSKLVIVYFNAVYKGLPTALSVPNSFMSMFETTKYIFVFKITSYVLKKTF